MALLQVILQVENVNYCIIKMLRAWLHFTSIITAEKQSGRSSGDQDRSETPRSFDEEGRSGSFELMVCAIATTASTHFQSFFPNLQDEEAQREFDELMRSSTTMKVSLTPDRLKSMEVCGHLYTVTARPRNVGSSPGLQAGEEKAQGTRGRVRSSCIPTGVHASW